MMKVQLGISSKFNWLFVALLLCGSAVSAQDYAFTVLGIKGSNEVDGSNIMVGSTLRKGQTITISEGAYLGLAHSNGQMLEVRKPGTYSISDLESRLSASNSSLAGKYAAMLQKELTEGSGPVDYKSAMARTGSVQRDLKDDLQLMIPVKSTVLPEKTIFKWYVRKDKQEALDAVKEPTYVFVVQNFFGDEIFKIETKDQMVAVDMTDPVFSADKYNVIVRVKEAEEVKTSKYNVNPVDAADAERIMETVSELMAEETAVSKLVLARFFEEEGLYANALSAYEQAIQISDAQAYRNLYEAFLDRNVMSEKAREEALKALNEK